jgi:general secretion pathway protein G
MMTRSSMRAGFSLVEIMIVLTIIGLIFGFLVTNLPKRLEKGKKDTTISTLRVLEQNIEEFYSDTGHYPERLEDLIKKPSNPEIAEKWEGNGPYLKTKSVPKDGWGNAIQYKLSAEGAEQPYELFSKGSKKTKGPISVSE